MINLPNGLFTFQEKCIDYLMDTTLNIESKNIIKIKAPTGAGKTILLIAFIEKYIQLVDKNTAFIWLCPGKGNLEEQSQKKMEKYLPNYNIKNLKDALLTGFEAGSTTFINWELVCKDGNNALKGTEKKNLYDTIISARNNKIKFIIIIDEEHSNNTSKAQEIIDLFRAKNIIRVSATTIKNDSCEFYEIDELDVIEAGLITTAVSVNEGVDDGVDILKDYDCLLDLADKKRREIDSEYKKLNKKIRPLVLIQFPSGKPKTVELVEKKLESMGYTTTNGMVAIWLSERKEDLPENLTENNGQPVFLLMKQAISTGWDCPRAKILVKLREGGTEAFQIQTLGRIRRMPEPWIGHYENNLLDFSYVYTLDEEFKAGLLGENNNVYEKRPLQLKKQCEDFKLKKEIKDSQYTGVGELDLLQKVYEFMRDNYHIGKKISNNKIMMIEKNYIFENEIVGTTIKGIFVESERIAKDSKHNTLKTRYVATSSNAGLQLNHVIYKINAITRINTAKIRVILDVLFWEKETQYKKYKVLNLNTSEYYAFVINNENLIVNLFKSVSSQINIQMILQFPPILENFKMKHIESYNYDKNNDTNFIIKNNAYEYYTDGFVSKKTRSKSERLFEEYCSNNDEIKWFYKNGDSGEEYFSIVYYNGFGEQSLFYPDYIVMKEDGTIWIIETKGGETDGHNNNIDDQIGNKFEALKRYCNKYNKKWGFVREKNSKDLYINNTEFHIEMSNSSWVPLKEIF